MNVRCAGKASALHKMHYVVASQGTSISVLDSDGLRDCRNWTIYCARAQRARDDYGEGNDGRSGLKASTMDLW